MLHLGSALVQYFEFHYFEIHYAYCIVQVETKKFIPILYGFNSPEMARSMEAEAEAEAEAVKSFLRKRKQKRKRKWSASTSLYKRAIGCGEEG